MMISIVIAAHNEEGVIGRCLDALMAEAMPGEFDVIVVANGCTDGTATAAARSGVRVVEIATASKSAALNAGDAVARRDLRAYLDADVVVSTHGMRVLCRALGPDGSVPLAVVPLRELEVRGRPLPVRAYFAISSRLPAFQEGLFGRGLIVLSPEGRRRFQSFPDLVADDLFLDSQFAPHEKQQVTAVASLVQTPHRTNDLVRRLARVRRGNAAVRRASALGEIDVVVRSSGRLSWFREVVLPRPGLALAAPFYVGITAVAAWTAHRTPDTEARWERDDSTRPTPVHPPTA